jgi:flagellar hook-associated protein 2
VTLTISPDTEGIQTEIEEFITKYNDVIGYLNQNMAVDPESSLRGMLAGNFTFTNLRHNLRSIVSGLVSSVESGNPQLLSEIGISIDRDGMLSLSDAEDFANAILEDPGQVADLFNSTEGIAVQLDDLLYDYVKAGGFIDDIEESVNNQIDFLDTRIERLEDRLAIREQELRDEMYELQNMLAALAVQQSYMQQYYSAFIANIGL